MANTTSAETNDVFQELDVDRMEVNVIESLCLSCGKNVSILFDLFAFVTFGNLIFIHMLSISISNHWIIGIVDIPVFYVDNDS